VNKTGHLAAGEIGFALGASLMAALTGCTTYVNQPRPREVYAPPPPVEAQASFGSVGMEIRAESDFYEPLTPYGRWEVVGSYGRCWIPGRIEANWRPYSDGYWQRTDAGWYWASDEPWGWATYHYGRWDVSAQFGWYWVPQTQWAPAWVSWHRGGGYIGWAPLYPSGVRAISPRAYVFVEERHFTEPVRRSTVIVNNTTIINNTVINEGPATAVIEKASGRKVQEVPVRDLRHKEEAAVIAKQRAPASTSATMAQPPVRSEAQPRENKPVPAREPLQFEKPAAAGHESVAPAQQNHKALDERTKPVPAAKNVKPAGNHPAAIRTPTEHRTEKQAAIQEKPVKPSDKTVQQPLKVRPDVSEKGATKLVKKDLNKKGKGKPSP
jgi:hypothetical protein